MRVRGHAAGLLIGVKIVVVLAALVSCASSAPSTPTSPSRPAVINHVVLFKLNDPADADALIADCDSMLGTIPGVVSSFAGKHIDTGRATVDSNYDVGFYVGFMDKQSYANYVDHRSHLAVVEKWRPRLQWLRVHDVLDETP